MDEKPCGLPTSLKIVAAMFILGGLVGLFEMGFSWRTRFVANVNPTVLGLLIGPGLLGRSRVSWWSAAAISGVLLIAAPILAAWMLVPEAHLHYVPFGRAMGRLSRPLGIGFCTFTVLVALWCLRALTSPAVRAAFGVRPRTEHPS